MSRSNRKYYAFNLLNEIKKKGFVKAEKPQELIKDIQRFYDVGLKVEEQKISLL